MSATASTDQGQQLDEQALLAGQLDFGVGNSFFGFAMTLRPALS